MISSAGRRASPRSGRRRSAGRAPGGRCAPAAPPRPATPAGRPSPATAPAVAHPLVIEHAPAPSTSSAATSEDDQHLLRVLAADPRDQQQAGAERTDDRADACWRHRRRRPGAPDPGPAPRPTPAPAESSRPRGSPPGSTAHRQRTRSSCNVNQGSLASDGLIGQYGSDCGQDVRRPRHRRARAAPGTTPAPRAAASDRAPIAEPRLLPMPRPTRNTARISEKV